MEEFSAGRLPPVGGRSDSAGGREQATPGTVQPSDLERTIGGAGRAAQSVVGVLRAVKPLAEGLATARRGRPPSNHTLAAHRRPLVGRARLRATVRADGEIDTTRVGAFAPGRPRRAGGIHSCAPWQRTSFSLTLVAGNLADETPCRHLRYLSHAVRDRPAARRRCPVLGEPLGG